MSTRSERQLRPMLRFVLIAILSVAALAGLAVGAVYSPIFDIDEVTAASTTHVSSEEVATAAAIKTGTPMLFTETESAALRIEDIPWVSKATVTKSYPGSIRIVFTERAPVASIEREPGRFAVLDETGRVLMDDSAPVHPILGGVEEIPSPGGVIAIPELAAVARDLGHSGLAQGILSVEQDSRGNRSYSVAMSDGIEVRLGSAREITRKARLAMKIHGDVPPGTEYIDISTPEHPVSGTGTLQTGESADPEADAENSN